MNYTNYFTLLGFEPSFEIDTKALEQNYFKIQQHFHPDRFVNRPSAEKIKALQVATDANTAYQTLKDPLPRAVYMLSLQGMDIRKDGGEVKPSQELLMEAMENREQLMEALGPAEIEVLTMNNYKAMVVTIDHLAEAFREKAFPKAAELAMKLKYLQKFADEIRIRKQKI
ncbi:MAG: Fe-S protein assembly co-chaperone HscB [Proteobacteria bacterium]|nr:Fe-S protein assembly co-chaperone HscB [Pseudomonadota bacterium]